MQHMAFSIQDTLHVILLGERDPSPSDWATYVAAIRAEEKKGIDVSRMRTLVFSDGGGPNAGQRKAVSDLLKGRSTPIAIVTGSAIMRGGITALRWFNPDVRAYAPEELREALAYLRVAESTLDKIRIDAKALLASLGLHEVKALEEARTRAAS